MKPWEMNLEVVEPDPLRLHSEDNVRTGKTVRNEDGSLSTVRSGSVNDERLNNGQTTLIPFVWDGQILDQQEATERAINSGTQWPTFPDHDAATAASKELSNSFNYEPEGAAKPWEMGLKVTEARPHGAEAWEDTSKFDQFGVGIAKPFVQMYQGTKDLLGFDLTEEERANLAALEQATGGYALAGEITGDLATLALPGGAIVKGAKNAPRLAKTIAALSEAALIGGYEGLKIPEAGEGRVLNAALAGGTALAIPGGVGMMKGLLSKRATREAAAPLLKKGIPLTPGQAYGGTLGWVENRLANMPLVGRNVSKLQNKALREWNRDLLQEVTPLGVKVKNAGQEGFKQTKEAYSKIYSDVWNRVKLLDDDGLNVIEQGWSDMFRRIQTDLPAEQAGRATRMMVRLVKDLDNFAESGNPRLLAQMDKTIREAGKKLDPVSKEWYTSTRQVMRDALPKGFDDVLKQIDSQYQKFSTLRDAAGKAGAIKTGYFTPDQLLAAATATKRATPNQKVIGTPLINKAKEGIGTVGSVGSNSIEKSAQLLGVGGLGYLDPTLAASAIGVGAGLTNEPIRKLLVDLAPKIGAPLATALRRGGATQANETEIDELLRSIGR